MSPSAHSIGRHGFHHIACSSMPRALPPPGSPSPGLVRVRPGRVSGGSCPSGYAKYERVGGWATHRWRATRRCPRPQPWLPAQRPCSAAYPQTFSTQRSLDKKKNSIFVLPSCSGHESVLASRISMTSPNLALWANSSQQALAGCLQAGAKMLWLCVPVRLLVVVRAFSRSSRMGTQVEQQPGRMDAETGRPHQASAARW